MLSASKLDEQIKSSKADVNQLAAALSKGSFSQKQAASAIRNWRKGLFKPIPKTKEIETLANTLGVEPTDISEWKSTVKYAAGSPRKARLVTQLIAGKGAQQALDILKFTHKRAARTIEKALKCAVANADESSADVENLYVCQARVDSAGVRIGTKRWFAKDRGRAHSIRKMASHIHVAVTEI